MKFHWWIMSRDQDGRDFGHRYEEKSVEAARRLHAMSCQFDWAPAGSTKLYVSDLFAQNDTNQVAIAPAAHRA